MQIKIRADAKNHYIQRRMAEGGFQLNWQWADKLDKIQGRILDVETEYLFQDQFNTPPIDGVSDIGLRIRAESVEYVLNDERPGKMYCNWCGETNEQANTCPNCGKSESVKWFHVFDEKVPSCQMLDPW